MNFSKKCFFCTKIKNNWGSTCFSLQQLFFCVKFGHSRSGHSARLGFRGRWFQCFTSSNQHRQPHLWHSQIGTSDVSKSASQNRQSEIVKSASNRLASHNISTPPVIHLKKKISTNPLKNLLIKITLLASLAEPTALASLALIECSLRSLKWVTCHSALPASSRDVIKQRNNLGFSKKIKEGRL